MMELVEIDKSEIYEKHNDFYFENAVYYNVVKDDKILCICGVLPIMDNVAEAFWVKNSFHKNVLSKRFFSSLFVNMFSLGYKVLFTWTRCKKLISIFEHYRGIGIEKVDAPAWDKDPTKTWFMKRI